MSALHLQTMHEQLETLLSQRACIATKRVAVGVLARGHTGAM